MEACNNPEILRVIMFISQILKVVFIIVPIGLILMIGLDLFKNITAGKEDEMKKNISIAIKRIIFCVCIFFVPTIVNLVNSIVNEVLEDTTINYTVCFKNATASNIENLIETNAKQAVENAKTKRTMQAVLDAETAVEKLNEGQLKNDLTAELKTIKEEVKQEINNNIEEEEQTNPVKPNTGDNDNEGNSGSGGNYSGQDEINPSDIQTEGSKYSTGYLGSPLNINATHNEYIASIGANSKEIYYLKNGSMNGAYHGGTDLPVGIGTNVYAMDGGTVYKVQDGCGYYGRHIILEHIVNNKKYYTIYAHLDSITAKYLTIGRVVTKGSLIAKSGNTYHCGSTVAAHLHIGISYNSNGSFPQVESDASFLIGNFIGTGLSYGIVDQSNLSKYKKIQY